MNIINAFRALAIAALVFAGSTNTRAGDQVPAKVRTSGIMNKTYIANPNTVPLGTPFVLVEIAAEGRGTLLGKYSIIMTGQAWVEIVNGAPTAVSEGEWTATAANGDTVYGTFKNYQSLLQPADQPKAFTGTAQTLGGTGRFEGTTGFETTTGMLTALSPTVDVLEYEHDGWMSSIGSLKRNK